MRMPTLVNNALDFLGSFRTNYNLLLTDARGKYRVLRDHSTGTKSI